MTTNYVADLGTGIRDALIDMGCVCQPVEVETEYAFGSIHRPTGLPIAGDNVHLRHRDECPLNGWDDES